MTEGRGPRALGRTSRGPGPRARGGFVAALLASALALALLSAGCNARSAKDAEADRHARAQALIESGNESYKVGDYRLAARRYAAAAVIRKDDPAAYFGLGMALSKLGRDEEARQAYARSRELSQGR